MRALVVTGEWEPRAGFAPSDEELRGRWARDGRQVWRHPSWAVTEVSDPRLREPADVVIRVRAAGLAVSTLRMTATDEEGYVMLPYRMGLPLVPGHEFAGEVVEAGPAAAGKAEKVDGGFRVTGTFRYASGLWNSTHTFLSSMVNVDGSMTPTTFLIELDQPGVKINDDWHMSGMAATGSASVTLSDVFIRDSYSIPLEGMLSIDKHPGCRARGEVPALPHRSRAST